MILSVISNNPLQNFYLQDLTGKKINIELDTYQNIPNGWYELKVEYVDTKIEIEDILINNASIKHILYTGYCTDKLGNKHQPASAVWDKGCVFSIWLHTSIGTLFHRIFDGIRNGDYGTNLFENYVLTVDRPHITTGNWPERVSSFFASAYGPKWWRLNTDYTPWKHLDMPDYNPDEIVSELRKWLPCHFERNNGGYRMQQLTDYGSDLPFVEIQDIPSKLVQQFIRDIGYTRLIDIAVHELDPGTYIDIHRDDHYNRAAYPYMRGCKKFYWACKESSGVYFKHGTSGLLPIQHPLLINTIEHVHSVIHEGNKTRTTILAYGEIC